MLSYVAHIPHSPLLLPQISRSRSRQFKQMNNSIQELVYDIHSKNCDSIILVSPLGKAQTEHYVFNIAPEYSADFSEYADFETEEHVAGEPSLAYVLRHALGNEYTMYAITEPVLDTACGTAMIHMQTRGAKHRILPLAYGTQSAKEIYRFGTSLRSILEQHESNIAIISLGDLARTDAANPEPAEKVDKELITHLKDRNTTAFLKYHPHKINSFFCGGHRSLALILGLLKDMNYKTDIVNYEQKHGVGMLAARFIF